MKYQISFTESCTYTVEVELPGTVSLSDVRLDEEESCFDPKDSVPDWMKAIVRQYGPSWKERFLERVEHREILSFEEVKPARPGQG
jgi:hypothetical protein